MERTPDSKAIPLSTGTFFLPHGSASYTDTTNVENGDDVEYSGQDSELDGNDLEPIAICGFSIKFPQEATSPDAFWKMICEGRNVMTEFPQSRMNKNGFYRKDNKRNTLPVQGGHFIKEDLGAFDADFFSISPLEAASMDPMQRWLLEAAYRAFENAGIPMEKASGSSTAVFTGSFGLDWMLQLSRDPETPPTYAASGFGLSMLANRLSWFFNLCGPSIGVDSACSSTAMAIDLACQSLRSGSCDASLIAGCNLTFAPEPYTWMSNIGFLSPDSRCKSFDHRANGYARGEGVGVMIVKRLSDAIRDGNTIRAVIRSTGANEDGRTPGITQPSRQAQERLIRETYRRAGLSLAHTRYFEAHGTGTAIGDPREAQAIGSAFQKYRTLDDPVYVGAVKSNIGHLEGASGLAGVIKAVLVLENGIIPPNANFEKLNPKIDADYLRLKFPSECEPWPTAGLRRASIASFGYGGANAHVILDDAYNFLRLRGLSAKHCTVPSPPLKRRLLEPINEVEGLAITDPLTPKLLVLSAADQQGISRLVEVYQEHLKKPRLQSGLSGGFIDDLAFTLDTHRSQMAWRSFVVSASVSTLGDLKSSISSPMQVRNPPPRLGFVFTGQGSQWYGMGRELISYSTFKSSLEGADVYLRQLGCLWSVIDELSKPREESNVDDPEFSQTLCTVVQVALVDLLCQFKILPAAVAGHSSGEIVAAYCSGHISRSSAWKLAYFRGVLVSKLLKCPSPDFRGCMMAVGLSEDAIRPYLCSVNTSAGKPALNIACVNSPNNVTISGDESLIDQLRQQLDKQSVFARKLRVSVAYHSQQMNAISEEYIKLVGSIDPDTQFGKVPMISSVTKTRATGEQLTQASYWAQNMVSPVQFSAAILAMCESSAVSLTKKIDKSHAFASVVDHLVEVGPHAALQGPIREILRISPRGQDIGYSSVLRRYSHAIETTLSTVGELHCMGCQVDLRAVNEPDTSSRLPRSLLVNLPEYPFDHSQTHWFESRLSKNYRSRAYAPLELLGVRSNDWNRFDSRWRNFIRTREMPWVEQHKVNGTILYPGAGMLAMAIEAAKQLASPAGAIQGYVLHNVHFENAMNLSSSSGVLETQISLRPAPSRKDPSYMYDFTVYSIESEDWQTNCHGVIEVEFQEDQEDWEGRMKAARFVKLQDVYQDVISKCSHSIDTPKMYEFLKKAGLDYGPVFQATQNQRISNTGEAAAEVTLFGQPDDDPEAIQPHVIHPASLDAILHLCFTALSRGGVTPMATSVPSRVKYMWISDRGLSRWEAESLTAFSKLTHKNGRGFSVDTGALDRGDAGQLRFFIEGLELTNITHTPPPDNFMPHPDQSYLNIDSKIALSKLSADETASYLEGKHQAKEDPTQFFHDLRALLKISLSHLVQMTDAQTYEQENSWKKHYLDWAHHHLGNDLLEIETPQSLEEACSKVDRNGCVGRIYAEVARNLAGIFTGEVDPLELLFSSDLAKDYYEEIATYKSSHQFAEYLDLLAHEKPGLSILEVGGGTGAGTRNIVKALKAHAGGDTGTLRCRRYDFTDVSASFFDKARHEFEDVKLKMNYRILDIEKDIAEQGFEDNSYDVVIAINVLHVTQSVKKSLQNIRKAMKAGGKLIVQEPLKPDGGTLGFIFGLLPGWWLGIQDGRQLSPSLSVEAWDAVLKECGFSGPEMVFRDFDQYHAHETGVFITTAVEKSSMLRTLKEHIQPVIIVGKGQELEEDVARDLIYPLSNLFGIRPHFQSLSEAARETDLASKFLIFLDHRSVFLDTMTEETWSQLQLLLLSAHDLLWITAAGGADPNPGYGMLDGFSRVLRSEHYDLHLVTLALDFGNRYTTEKIQHIMQIVEEMATTPVGQNYEEDYVEVDGLLHIKRVVEANYVRAALETQLAPYMPVQVRLSEAPPFELDMMVTGQMNSMCYMQSSGATGELGPGMVEVEVKAVSLDRRDYNTTQGQNDDNKFGGFCAGIILRAGSDVSIRPGARVFGWCHGSFRSQVVMAADLVAELPGSISFSSACALIPPSLSVHYALIEEGRLRSHDRVLIHDGSSPVGQAAIKLCRELGVKQLWATTTSEQGRNCIVDTLGLPEENVLPVSSLDRQIKELAPKKAFDIVLAADFHPATPHSLSYVKPRGRYIQLSSTSGGSNELPKMLDIPSSVSLSQIGVRDTIDQDPRAMRESLGYSVKHASMAGNASFPHYTTSHLSEIFEHLRGCRDGERVVVDLNAEDTITVMTKQRPAYDLGSDGTYIVVGGLGGLGLVMARWLVSRGARNLVLLSRSGPKTSEAKEAIAEFNTQGVCVAAPLCDATDKAAVQSMLTNCGQTMPPVKGCILASMVLNDCIFAKMTFPQWKATIDAKVKVAQNFDCLLPSNLHFFVLITSMMGVVGGISLANYAAGNTYQDALARHRIKRGERAVALSLGPLVDGGYLTVKTELLDGLDRSKRYVGMTSMELCALLDIYCDPSTPFARDPVRCQPIMGIKPQSYTLADGGEVGFSHHQPFWGHMHHVPLGTRRDGESEAVSDSSTSAQQLLVEATARVAAAKTPAEAAEVITWALAQRVAALLAIPEDRLDTLKPMHSYGIDSLTAVDMRNWVAKTFDVDIAVFDILGGATFASAGSAIASKAVSKRRKEGNDT